MSKNNWTTVVSSKITTGKDLKNSFLYSDKTHLTSNHFDDDNYASDSLYVHLSRDIAKNYDFVEYPNLFEVIDYISAKYTSAKFGDSKEITLDNDFARMEQHFEKQKVIAYPEYFSEYHNSIGFESPQEWEPYHATEELVKAMQRLQILPDVSKLHLDDIAKLREEIKDELDPMRAELLRMTEQLRTMVGEKFDPIEVSREAENLIKTRVESTMREAASHLKSIQESRIRKLIHYSLKTIGIIGLGFTNPATFGAKAIEESVKMAGSTFELLDKIPIPQATVRLSLKLGKLLN